MVDQEVNSKPSQDNQSQQSSTVEEVQTPSPTQPTAQTQATMPGAREDRWFFQSTWFWVISVVFIISFAAGLFLAFAPLNYVIVFDQPYGQAVKIKRAGLSKGGFFAIHRIDEFGRPAEIVASSLYLQPGVYSDFSMEVYQDEQAPKVEPGEKLFAAVWVDNGDQELEISQDVQNPDFIGRTLWGTRATFDFLFE